MSLSDDDGPDLRPLGPAGMSRPADLKVDVERTRELEERLAAALDELVPDGYRRVDLNVAMLVGEVQLQVVVLMQDGRQVTPEVNDPDLLMSVREALEASRREFYEPGLGTWFGMRLMLNFPDRYSCRYDFRYEPEWNPPVDPEKYAEDFDAFPRSEWYLPYWLRERLDRARPEGWAPFPNQGLHPAGEQLYRQREILDRLSDRLGQTMPSGADRLTIVHRALGDHVEVDVELLDVFMDEVDWRPPGEVFDLLGLLREEIYKKGAGTWFTARLRMENIVTVDIDWDDRAEPAWDVPPPPEAYAEELRRFPRDPEFVPSWLARRVAGEDVPEPRMARTHDGLIPLPGGPGGLPTFSDRPVLSDEEHAALLGYLEGAPVAATLEGADTDLFLPDQPGVARVYRTDGAWVWPELVIHYLRERRIAPESALVEHARSTGFQVPEVDEPARAAAAAVVSRNVPPASSGSGGE